MQQVSCLHVNIASPKDISIAVEITRIKLSYKIIFFNWV